MQSCCRAVLQSHISILAHWHIGTLAHCFNINNENNASIIISDNGFSG